MKIKYLLPGHKSGYSDFIQFRIEMSNLNGIRLIRLVDAEDFLREDIINDFMKTAFSFHEIIKLNLEELSDYREIVDSETDQFLNIIEESRVDMSSSGSGRKSLSDQIKLLNGMKIYSLLHSVGSYMGYDLVLFGGWLVRVLAGLSMDGDLDVYVGGHGISVSAVKQLKERFEIQLPEGVTITQWSFDDDETPRRRGYSADIMAHCYEIHFSNGIKIDLLTRKPDTDRVDFNINQLQFTPSKGIHRRTSNGCVLSWPSILMGLYTKSCVTVNDYGKIVDLENPVVSPDAATVEKS